MNSRIRQLDIDNPRIKRDGFTLVEMLVSTALVVLIMTLFAQIYASAISTITEQRGLGNNDQKARILSSILHNDLKAMTYKQTDPHYGTAAGIVALTKGDDVDLTYQKGYFYLSENDPYNDFDDVLQFTAMVEATGTNANYVGNVADLGSAVTNQPYRTDNGPTRGTAQSEAAEITYFLRKGTLYRRVLLLRDPPTQTPPLSVQPGDSSGNNRYDVGHENYDSGSNLFWNDFDYSATRAFYVPDPSDPKKNYSVLWFNSVNSLANNLGSSNQPIAFPWNRFGHLNDPQNSSGNSTHGMPREYLESTAATFIGRLTHEETSNLDYPGVENYAIFDRSQTIPNGLNTEGAISNLAGGPRLGEDILLTNVETFDVEVWDSSQSSFVQLGYSGTGDFSSNSNKNPGYGPRNDNSNNVFDTWHPDVTTVSSGFGSPPYRPVQHPTQVGTGVWTANTTYSLNDTIRINSSASNSLLYQVVNATDKDMSGTTTSGTKPPSFTPTPGQLTHDTDVASGGAYEITWKCIDNRIGLRAIRITIRYVDLQSRLPRQLTILHSFAG